MSSLSDSDPATIQNTIADLQNQIDALRQQVLDFQALSEAAPELGDIDFRATNNGILRMIMSAIDIFDEFGIHAYFAGFDAQGLAQFYLSADDGKAYFAGGLVTLDLLGFNLAGLNYLLNFSATYSGNTRNASIGMQLPPGSSVPAWMLAFFQPGASESLTNPGFETGSYASGWTAAADLSVVASGTGNYGPVTPYAGSYMTQFLWSGVSGRTLAGSRVAVSAGQSWTTGLRLWLDYPNITVLAQLLWYDDPTAGSLLRTDTYVSQTAGQPGWTNPIGAFIAPVGAQSVKYLLTFSGTGLPGTTCFVDDCTLKVTTVYSSLSFEPHATLRGTTLDFDSLVSTPSAPNPVNGVSIYNSNRRFVFQDTYSIRGAMHPVARPDIRLPKFITPTNTTANKWIDCGGISTGGTPTRVQIGTPISDYVELKTGAVSGNNAYVWMSNVYPEHNPHMFATILTDSSIANMRFWVGMHSLLPTANPAPGTWATCKYDSTFATLTIQDNLDGFTHSATGPTVVDSTRYDIEIYLDYANHLVHYFVNGVHYSTNPSGTLVTGTALGAIVYAETRTSAAKKINARQLYSDEDT